MGITENQEKQEHIHQYEKLISGFKLDLISDYLWAVDTVKKKKGLSKEDKLKLLLAPLITLTKLNFPSYSIEFIPKKANANSNANSNLPGLERAIWIWIDRELDLEHLNYDHTKYRIDYKVNRPLSPWTKSIWLEEKERKDLKACIEAEVGWVEDSILGCISLHELYEKWLPLLNPMVIQSKDLLDQILVCYSIKRALNGDKKAIQKLYDLYKDTAQAIAVKMARKFNLSIEDMKQDAQILLWFLISGFTPENILSQLLSEKNCKIIMALPMWVKDFYIYYFSEYIPRMIKTILKESEEVAKHDEFQKGVLGWELSILLNPCTPIHEHTFWKNTPKRIYRFNSYSYQPRQMGPRRNLTTWLFGTFGKRRYGKLYQLLRDKYKSIVKEKSKTENSDSRDDFDEEHEDKEQEKGLSISISIPIPNISFFVAGRKRKKKVLQPMDRDSTPYKKSRKEIIKRLVKLGASRRDAQIFLYWKFDKLTQSKIAQKLGLSRRQIIRICQKVNQLIPSQ
uniref:Uncharacterized protein n=1 Tax=candidate division WOR-3 bacterium TaxID=2052148 RepID=A0A7V3KMW4_UNCW3